MPSLFRFLAILALIGGLAYAGMLALTLFVEVKPREISVAVPPDRFLKPQR